MSIDGNWELRSSWSLQKRETYRLPLYALTAVTLMSMAIPCLLNYHPHGSVLCLYPQNWSHSDFPFQTRSHFHTSSLWYIAHQIFHPFFFPHRCGMGFPSAWVLLSHEILVTRITLSSALMHHKKFYTYCVKSPFIQGSKNSTYEEERIQESEDGECCEQLSSRHSMTDAFKNS